jgi:ABC-2 type transport system permease protein
MKTTLRIAKLELSTLFYSPIAWFLLIIFLFQCGLSYTSILEQLLTMQDLGGGYQKALFFLTREVFAGRSGLFTEITGKLYLFIPLLTMGLMSRETSSGTIKLLYSSPIDVREIIFGKFLAMMLYNLLLIGILAIFAVCGAFNISAADPGFLLSGLLSLYLLLCAYSAIGLFMSCLTTYQVVAALSTLVTFAALYYVGTVWQDIDFVRDLTYFLSISGRTQNMIGGLITTKDIFYFVIIIGVFLSFSMYKLKGDRESKPLPVKAGRYAAVIVMALLLGYTTSRPGLIGYYDATATQSRTLTVNAQKTIREMKGAPLEVTSYINLLDSRYWYGLPSQRNADMARWEPYLRFKPDIHFNYVYYYDGPDDKYLFKSNPGLSLKALAEKYAKSFKVDFAGFRTPEEINRIIDLRPERNRYVMQLTYKGKTTFLRLFDDMKVFPGETETAAALKRLLQAKMPKIAFAEGELERSVDKLGDRQYGDLAREITFRYALVNQGFDVETVSLKDQEIPQGIAALVIADPKVSFDTAALSKIRQYIAGGGNLLIAGEPGQQSVLNPILQPLGVQLKEGMLVQQSKDYAPELVLPYLTIAAGHLTKALAPGAADSARVSMPGAAGLIYDSSSAFAIEALLMTDGKLSWNKKVHAPSDEVTFSAADGDEKGPVPTALSLTRQVRGREQRIIVTGDADFLSNAELGRRNIRTANFPFATALFGWLSYGQFPIDTSRPESKDNSVNITDGGLTALKILFWGVLPGLLLIFAAVLLIRRKRK